MPDHPPANGSRTSRTRVAIVDAFIGLAFERRYNAIRVSDLITRAGVGKSTFYDHFHSKDDVLLDAMRPVLLTLATAASGRAAQSYVQEMVCHLWERRSIGRPIIDSMTAPIIQRCLAEAIQPHAVRAGLADGNSSISATGIAAAQLAMLRSWLAGHATSTIDDMTDQLIACSRFLEIRSPLIAARPAALLRCRAKRCPTAIHHSQPFIQLTGECARTGSARQVDLN